MSVLAALPSRHGPAKSNDDMDQLPNPGRHTHIGRIEIDLIMDRPFLSNWKGTANTHQAHYVLVVPLLGSASFSQDGRTGVVNAGQYVLLSELSFYKLSSDEQACLLLLRIPTIEMRGRLVSIEDHISRRFKPNEQMSRLLFEMLKSIAELFLNSAPPNPQALATEIIGLISLTIGSEDRGVSSDVRNTRYHLRCRIADFIETNLSDQTLSPKKIAASSRISLSYLYSLFNDNQTTVGQYVQTKRLQRAYEMLVTDPKGHRTVSEIAYEVGFKNVSHFSRSFSRQFKISPRDIRQIASLSRESESNDAAATLAYADTSTYEPFGPERVGPGKSLIRETF